MIFSVGAGPFSHRGRRLAHIANRTPSSRPASHQSSNPLTSTPPGAATIGFEWPRAAHHRSVPDPPAGIRAHANTSIRCTIRWAPARWGATRFPWSMTVSKCMASRACGSGEIGNPTHRKPLGPLILLERLVNGCAGHSVISRTVALASPRLPAGLARLHAQSRRPGRAALLGAHPPTRRA
jgi:hypothetical protein